MRHDSFYRSFSEADRHWLEEIDLGGDNDYTTMTRFAIAKRMKAHTATRVKQAVARLRNKSKDDDDEESSGTSAREVATRTGPTSAVSRMGEDTPITVKRSALSMATTSGAIATATPTRRTTNTGPVLARDC